MTPVNAAPMTMPTARSTTFPRKRNFLNPPSGFPARRATPVDADARSSLRSDDTGHLPAHLAPVVDGDPAVLGPTCHLCKPGPAEPIRSVRYAEELRTVSCSEGNQATSAPRGDLKPESCHPQRACDAPRAECER